MRQSSSRSFDWVVVREVTVAVSLDRPCRTQNGILIIIKPRSVRHAAPQSYPPPPHTDNRLRALNPKAKKQF